LFILWFGVPPGLSFCNRCGADLRVKEESTAERSGPGPNRSYGHRRSDDYRSLLVNCADGFYERPSLNDGLINGFAAAILLSIMLVDVLFAWLLLSAKRGQTKSNREKLKSEDGQGVGGSADSLAAGACAERNGSQRLGP